MRRQKSFILAILLSLPLVLFGRSSFAGVGGVYIASPTGHGGVDYSSRVMRVKGVAPPQPAASNAAEGRVFQLRVAKIDAFRKAMELIKEVQVDAETTVENFMLINDVVKIKIKGMVRGLKEEGEPAFLDDGTIEQWYVFPLQQDFTEVVMEGMKPEGSKPLETFGSDGVVFSGLVVDARGLGVKPAMLPSLIAEDGRKIYCIEYVDKKHVLEQGIAGYANDVAAAKKDQRVGEKPLVVKGLKTQGQGKTDIVISNGDADKIRANVGNMAFIRKCGVIIIL